MWGWLVNVSSESPTERARWPNCQSPAATVSQDGDFQFGMDFLEGLKAYLMEKISS